MTAAIGRAASAAAGALPRRPALYVGLAFTAWAFAAVVSEQPGVGRVVGKVVLPDGRPAGPSVQVYLSPSGPEATPRRTRVAMCGEDGRFRFPSVAAGVYSASALAKAHSGESAEITVGEGETASVAIRLRRTEPDLALQQIESVFSTRENARIAVRGYVDPARGRSDTFRLRVHRTRLASLMRDPVAASELERLRYGLEWDHVLNRERPMRLSPRLLAPVDAPPAEIVLDTQQPITGPDREGFFHQRVDLGRIGTGLYLAEVTHGPERYERAAAGWILVTDTALVVTSDDERAYAYAADITTGAPLAGVTVVRYRQGRELARTVTDASGLAPLPGRQAGQAGSQTTDTRLLTVALNGQDEAVVASSIFGIENAGQFRLHTYTDRPIYRPGNLVHFKGVLRRALDSGAHRYAVPAGQPVNVEVRDPNGDRVARQALMAGPMGAFHSAFTLDSEAPTGVYSLVLTVAGERFTHDVVVASYRKPEFEVRVAPAHRSVVRGEPLEFTVQASYYFGAPLAGARLRYYVTSSTGGDMTEGEYGEFGDFGAPPTRRAFGQYHGELLEEREIALDGQGRAIIRVSPRLPDGEDAPSVWTIAVTATVRGAADRDVIASASARVHAAALSTSVEPDGYLAAPGQPTSAVVSVRDLTGTPAPGVPVEVALIYQSWIDGELTRQPAGTLRATTGPDGRALVHYTPPREGDLRLVASAADVAGRRTRSSVFVWVSGDDGEVQTEYADLALMADRRSYNPGDTARVMIAAARTGQHALVIVNSERIFRSFTVPLTRRTTFLRIPVLAEYGPNVYVSAFYIRNKRFAQSQLPLRVAVPNRELTVTIAPNRPAPTAGALPRYGPGDTVAYTVRAADSQGRPVRAELSLSVVDESIYALREDSPQDVFRTFYPPRRNQVQTDYSFAVRWLGVGDKAEPVIAARRRFLDTAHWSASVVTDERGVARIRAQLPDNLTTWRATAVAHTAATEVGWATAKVIASKDFHVSVDTPRFLTQGDQSRIAAVVHNETAAHQVALVRLRTWGMAVEGDTTVRVEAAPGRSAMASWTVEAREHGPVKLLVTAWTLPTAGGRQFTDGVEATFPVRAHGRELVASLAGEATAQRPGIEVLRLERSAVPGTARLRVRVTPSPLSALRGGMEYLIGFPYGCTEQTMSRMLPTMLVHELVRRGRLTREAAGTSAHDLPAMVRSGLVRLGRMQLPDGGWSWFERGEPDPWMTAYVLYGMATARSLGYSVDERSLQAGRRAALAMAARPIPMDDGAFLLYALALAGDRAGASRLRAPLRLERIGPAGLASIVLLDRLLQRDPRPALNLLMARARRGDQSLNWEGDGRQSAWPAVASTAIALKAMLAVDPTDPRVAPVVRWLMLQRTDSWWRTTLDTSMTLTALCDYLEGPGHGLAVGGSVRVALNGSTVAQIPVNLDTLREGDIAIDVAPRLILPDRNEVSVTRSAGGAPVFYAVTLRQTVAAPTLPAVESPDVRVTRSYLRMTPRKDRRGVWSLVGEPTENRFSPGDHVRVRLVLDVKRPIRYVVIEDPFPSGCEPSDRGAAEEVIEWGYWWDSVDVRDDRVAFFARSLAPGRHVIEYNLRAQTPGVCKALPTLVQCMYEPDARAESASDTLRLER
ncbi:MAG TPA: MG2 domain-containing protein [Chthonomonadales bacterium]|nr:MG2 domain-containing protein [Chthonomonadales bacterium]